MNTFKNAITLRWKNGVETIEGYIGLFLTVAVSPGPVNTPMTLVLRWSGSLRVANSIAGMVSCDSLTKKRKLKEMRTQPERAKTPIPPALIKSCRWR